MTDYDAEAEAAKLATDAPVDECLPDIVAALKAAEKRGRVAGLREAAAFVETQTNFHAATTCHMLSSAIITRAEEVERS